MPLAQYLRTGAAAVTALGTLAAGAGFASWLGSPAGLRPPASAEATDLPGRPQTRAASSRFAPVADAKAEVRPHRVHDAASDRTARGGEITVAAPQVDVKVGHDRVRVAAPRTWVDIDANAGRAIIRAPGVNLDLRW